MDLKRFAFNNISRNFRAYLGYFLSCAFSIMIFFAFAVSMFHPMIRNSGMSSGSTAFAALMTTEVIIFGFSMLFIIYSLSNFVKSRNREFGTLTIIGMSNKQFKKLLLLENLIIGILSIICGIIFGLLLSKVFLVSLSKIFYMDLNSAYFPVESIIITIIVFVILFMITGPLSLRLINKKGMLDLLKGDVKPKKEIKASKFKGILGLILILLSYTLIMFSDKLNIDMGMYSLAAIVIVGLYLFFSQFVVMVLNSLKKNEAVYQKHTNMLLISNLVYKMRDNSRLLFLITVLLSGTLIALSVTGSIVNNQGETSKSNFPMAYSYFSDDKNQNEDKELYAIRNTIKDLNAKEISFEMLDNDFNIILNESNYNKLAKEINVEPISLNKDESFLVTRYSNSTNSLNEIKESKIDNKTLRVKGVSDKIIFPNGMFNSITVINDDLYSDISNKFSKMDFYGFDYDNWETTGEITDKLKRESFRTNYDEERHSYFLTLPDIYLVELQQSKILQFMGTCIGVIFFIAVLSFLYFRLFTDETHDKIKYNNLSKIGLSFNEMKKIVNVEIGSLFLIPFIMSAINTVVAVYFVNNTLNVATTLNSFTVLAVLLVLYIGFFLVIKNRYIKNIWDGNR